MTRRLFPILAAAELFIRDAACEASVCEELIAEIAETCFTFLSGF